MIIVSNIILKLDSFTFDLKLPYIRQGYLQPQQISLVGLVILSSHLVQSPPWCRILLSDLPEMSKNLMNKFK